jgi:hypothetical protein
MNGGSMQLSLVEEFEEVMDYYQVCREDDRCWVTSKNGKVLKTGDCHGYRQYGLYLKSGKRKMISEHRLFAICFIQNPENFPQVNHIDSNRSNNSLSNFAWCDNSGNQLHAYEFGCKKPILGENHGCAKLKDSEIPLIFDMRKSGLTLKAIGNHFGIHLSHISNILSGKKRSQIQ